MTAIPEAERTGLAQVEETAKSIQHIEASIIEVIQAVPRP